MCNGCCFTCKEVPLNELAQQIEYARTVCSDLNEIYSEETPKITKLMSEYQNVRTKLSMLMDFLFQAKLWHDTVMPDTSLCPEKNSENEKEEK